MLEVPPSHLLVFCGASEFITMRIRIQLTEILLHVMEVAQDVQILALVQFVH